MDAPGLELVEWKSRKPFDDEKLEALAVLAGTFAERLVMALLVGTKDERANIAAQGSKDLWAAKQECCASVGDDGDTLPRSHLAERF
jgi:hypothetical protein